MDLNELIENLNRKITGPNQLDYNEVNAIDIQTNFLQILATYEQMIEEIEFRSHELEAFKNSINISLINFWQWGTTHIQDIIEILEATSQDQITQELLDTTVFFLNDFGKNVYFFIKNLYEQNQRLFREIQIINFYENLSFFQGQVASLVNSNKRHLLDNLLNLEYTFDIDRQIYSHMEIFYGNAFFTNNELYIPQQIQQSVTNLQFAGEQDLFQVYYQMYIDFLVKKQKDIFTHIDNILNTSQSDSEQSVQILTNLVSFYEEFAEFHKDRLPNQTSVVRAAIAAWRQNRNMEAAINQQRQKLGIMPTTQNLATSSTQNLATSSTQNLTNQDQKKVNQRRNGFLKGFQKRRNQAKGRSSTSSSSSNLQLDINKQELKEMMKALQTRQKQIQTRQRQLQTERQRLQRQKNAPSDPPEEFLCPITYDVMKDPVISNEGISFERSAIERWLRSANRCPISRKPLQRSDLRPNVALRNLIGAWNTNQKQKALRRRSSSGRQPQPRSSSGRQSQPRTSSGRQSQPRSSSGRQSQPRSSSGRQSQSSSSSRSSTVSTNSEQQPGGLRGLLTRLFL